MKLQSILVLLAVMLVACGMPAPTRQTAVVPPSQVTPFPTLPLPTATQAPTITALPPSPVPTQTALPPTATLPPPATEIPKLDAPGILTTFSLNKLPGEGRAPAALALLNGELYVANRGSANLGIIDQEVLRAFVPLGTNPSAIVADAARNRIYASGYETPTVYLVEDGAVQKQVPAGGRINALAVEGDTLFVALDNEAIIERYDANTLAKRDQLKLSQGFGVSSIVVDAPRHRLYAAVYGKIVAVDLTAFRELNTLEAPYLYAQFAVNPADGSIWSGAYDEVSFRSYVVGYTPAGQELGRLFLGADLNAVAIDGKGRLFVLDHFNNQVHVISIPELEVHATIPVNEAPSDAIVDPGRNVLYVANQDNDNISAIDLETLHLVNTIPLANTITALAANPVNKRVYALNGSTNSMYVIEGDKVVDEVATGNSPADLAVDEILQRLYVANRADGTLTVIDEKSLDLIASQYITRYLSTVAVDVTNKKLFAGSVLLDPETLSPVSVFYAQGLTLDSQTMPQYARANPALKKLYAVASNGVPGSNSRVTLFRFLYDALSESKMLGSANFGNTSALAIDPDTNQLFATSTHPLAYSHGLDVYDADDTRVHSLVLPAHTTALAVNPTTHHLFLSHNVTYVPYAAVRNPLDNTVQVLDTRTLGHVAVLDVPNEPWRMTILGDKIYVARLRDGDVTVIQDAVTTQPPAPTPTLTPTPYPTLANTETPKAVTPVHATPTVQAVGECVNPVPVRLTSFQEKAQEIGIARLGCTRALESESEAFAYQPLERGFMVDDYREPNAKKVYVFFPDGSFKIFDDTFRDGDDDKICPEVNVPGGKWRPKRGFGTVWCNVPEVQALGAGLAEEHNAKVTAQEFGNAVLWSLPDRGVIVLWADGTWE